ncbi:MAG: DUF3068 domain-containing protein [Nocardioides sp.]|uniref:DUF3068 domain-containing protein n=1 Tax=Nocardioides sp. TaxID=35761 RepID=UPI0039E5857F
MKKVLIAWVLLLLGAFLLTTAVLARFWGTPNSERTPLNTDNRTYLTGQAQVLDPATGKVNDNPVKITNITQVDAKRSSDSVIVFVTATCVNVDEDDPADCLPDSDPRMISVSQSNFATDRHTGEAVNDSKYVTTDTPMEGLVNKWPFNPERKTYQVWDSLTASAHPAEYVGTDTIDGLKVYQYHEVITDAPIDLGNNIDALYNLDETYWIDARTGAIIKQELHDVRTLKDGGDTALDLTAQYSDKTVSANVSDAKANAKKLNLVSKTIPLGGLVTGLIALLGGAALLLRGGRSASSESESETEDS